MIPYPYNMVDMGGIDLAEANGSVVEGLYAKIVEAVNACGDVVLYNWKFAGIEIAPQHTSILIGNPIIINGAAQVTEQDEVTVPGINPDPPILVPIEITENGQYSPSDYNADGFSEVDVDVEYDPPTLLAISVDSNGTYLPSQYDADGFSSVTVNVPATGSSAVGVETKQVGGSNASLQVTYNSYQSTEVFFLDVSNGNYQDFGFVRVMYNVSASQSPDGVAHSGWAIFALSNCVSNGVEYSQNQLIRTWAYNVYTLLIAYQMEGE